jgi:Tfp pilus assembly protein PilZ
MAEKEAKERSGEAKEPCRVSCHIGDEVRHGTSLHFNERGILVVCDRPAPLNTKVKLVLEFPGFKNPIQLSGEVVWTNIYGNVGPLTPKGMGVKFLNLDRDLERMMADLAAMYECYTSMFGCYYS